MTAIDALEVGLSSVALGAGRTRSDQAVDHAVGIELHKVVGDKVAEGEALASLHVHDARAARPIARRVEAAFKLGARRPKDAALVLGTIR